MIAIIAAMTTIPTPFFDELVLETLDFVMRDALSFDSL